MKAYKGIAVALAAAILASGGGVATSLATAQSAQAASTQSDIDAAVTEILNQTNTERANAGLAPLKLNAAATTVAQSWSQQMATQQSMIHNPNYQTQMPQPWIRVGENVGQGYTKDTIVAAWMASPGHRANILGDFTHIGIGYWVDDAGRGWFTQDFGKYDVPVLTAPNTPVTTVDKFSITAAWDRKWNENVDGYEADLYGADGTLLQTQNIPVSNGTVTFTGLTDLTSYTVNIVSQSTNALGEQFVSPATTFTATTLEDLPTVTAPSNLALTPSETTLAASWTAPVGFNGSLQPYTVELFKAGVLVSSVQTTDLNYTFSGLASNTTYTVNVTATTAVRAKTATAIATLDSKTLLSSVANVTDPTNLTAVPDPSSLQVTWGAPASQTGVSLTYLVTLSTAGQPDIVVETSTPSYTFTGLTSLTDYAVKVQANIWAENGVNKATSTGVSVIARTLVDTTALEAPNAPTSFKAVPDYNTVNLSWTAPTGVVGGGIANYTVTVKQTGAADKTFNTTGTTYTVSGLSENTAYTMNVVANVTSTDGSKSITSPSANLSVQTFARFTDANSSSFPTEVNWMKTAGISTGYGNGTYRPYDTVNREQMAAFMYRMAGRPAFTAIAPFTDANSSSFPTEVNWMKTAGISTGYTNGTYRPYDTVNREQMAAFMQRYATKVCGINVPASKYFVDTKYSSFPAEVAWMGGAGISTGYWDGTYRPYDPVNREQMAAFMYRLNNYINTNGGCHH